MTDFCSLLAFEVSCGEAEAFIVLNNRQFIDNSCNLGAS